MKTRISLLSLFYICFFLGNNLAFGQCYHYGCHQVTHEYGLVKAINYPKSIPENSDLTFDVSITLPACLPTYTGYVIIARMQGVPPLRYLDTVYVTVTSGTTTIIPNILMTSDIVNEGYMYQDSSVHAIDVIFKDDPNCTPSWLDPAPADASKWIAVKINGINGIMHSSTQGDIQLNFSDDGMVKFTGLKSSDHFYIYNTTGHLIYSDSGVNTSTSIAYQPSGIYLVTVINKEGYPLFRQKVVKL